MQRFGCFAAIGIRAYGYYIRGTGQSRRDSVSINSVEKSSYSCVVSLQGPVPSAVKVYVRKLGLSRARVVFQVAVGFIHWMEYKINYDRLIFISLPPPPPNTVNIFTFSVKFFHWMEYKGNYSMGDFGRTILPLPLPSSCTFYCKFILLLLSYVTVRFLYT